MSDDNEISKRIADQLRRIADARNEHATSLTETDDHLTKGNE